MKNMPDENLGLVAFLHLWASIIASLFEYKMAGAFFGVVGLVFAVFVGLSKRAKNKTRVPADKERIYSSL